MILKINDKMKVESNFSHHKHETGEKRHNVSRLKCRVGIVEISYSPNHRQYQEVRW